MRRSAQDVGAFSDQKIKKTPPGLDVPRPREHVHGLRPLQAIAPRGEALHVPGEGGGVAGDVGQRGNAGVGDGLQQRGVGALAGRVEYGGVKALAPLEQAGDLCGGVAADEAGPVASRPLRAALRFASAMAGGTISMPVTWRACRAAQRVIVPAPQ